MKILSGIGLLLVSTLLLSDTLTILNWEGYLDSSVISRWQKQSGHTLQQIYFDNDEDRDSVMVGHKDRVIDLVVLDESASKTFGASGTLLAFKSNPKVANIQGVDQRWQDVCGDYSVPYLWGTLGVAYRTDKILSAPTSWHEILTPNKALSGHIGLMDDFVDLLAPALFVDNHSINTNDVGQLKGAFERLKDLLPHVLTFEYSISFLDSSQHKDNLYMTLAYSGDQYLLNEKSGSENWDFTTLKEGTVAWMDCFAVMMDSPRQDLALDFLNFLYQPEIAALNSEALYVATPMQSARALQTREFLSDTTVYAPVEVMNKAQYYEVLDKKNILLRNRITSSLVKIHESK